METCMNLRSRLFVLTCGVVALIGMAMVGGLRLAVAQSVAETNDAADEEANLSAATSAHGGRFDFHGQVLDPDSKPLAGANVYFVRSDKSWVTDPAGVAWETYRTMADARSYTAEDAGMEAGADNMPAPEDRADAAAKKTTRSCC